MSPRTRIVLVVALAAGLAAAVVGAAVVAADEDSEASPQAQVEPRPGRPPLAFALGFREDPEARALAEGRALYERGRLDEARAVFARHDSLEAKVAVAFTSWPEGTLDRLEQLGKLFPEAAIVQLHLGLARLWARSGDPLAAWQTVVDEEPDTPYAILAGNLLFPKLPRGVPTFVPSFSAPLEVTRLPASRQLAALRARSTGGGVRELLLYGVGLQRVGRPVSAREVFERAARLHPRDVEARVAAAVGRFEKGRPELAFGQLGPLTRAFPDSPTVPFHLGLLLLWTGRIDEAERQFRLASGIEPSSALAREAARYLETLERARPEG